MNKRVAGLAGLFSISASAASACTICHSPTSLGVRHLLFEHNFWHNAAAIAAPIPLLFAVIYLANREAKPRKALNT